MNGTHLLEKRLLNFKEKGETKRISDLLKEIREMIEMDDFDPSRLERIKRGYKEIPVEKRPIFFKELIEKVETSKKDIEWLLREALSIKEGDPRWSRILTDIRSRVESPRIKLFKNFINISEGLKFLLDLRMDILSIQRKDELDLGPVDQDLTYLFNSWFQNGFLVLQEITLDSPYRQINYIQRHDMVHPMTTLEEMGRRLGFDRRCFALYHRAMADEPVVFIEVALTKGIIRSIHEIIDKEPEREATEDNFDTAIFYSINNTQEGLTGIGLGKVLIFQVVDYIKKTVPTIRTFSTLSPIPGFWKNYLKMILEGDDSSFLMKRHKLIDLFSERSRLAIERELKKQKGIEPKDFGEVLLEVLSDKGWIENPVYLKHLQKPMEDITYFYITKEKGKKGRPLNPVANFHMSNGAQVSKNCVNFLGNRSSRGLEESCGMMVNYIYSQSWFQQIKRSIRGLFSSSP
jgi:hypothetical protein